MHKFHLDADIDEITKNTRFSSIVNSDTIKIMNFSKLSREKSEIQFIEDPFLAESTQEKKLKKYLHAQIKVNPMKPPTLPPINF